MFTLKKGGEMVTRPAVKVERIHRLEGDGPTKAFCDLMVLDTFLIKGLRVVKGKEGLFLSMPRQQGKDGKWYDTVSPVSKEIRKGLENMVLDEYQAETADV
jgi:stage V sporulation protein G